MLFCVKDTRVALPQQLIPILVTARSYAEACGNSVAEHLAESLRLDGAVSTEKRIDAEAMKRLLFEDGYSFLAMIEGADEIVDPIIQREFFRKISADTGTLLANGHLVVLSTRPLYEIGSSSLKGLSLSYRLPFLHEGASNRLAQKVLGEEASADFARIATSTGLIAYLDTPLLLNLAMTLVGWGPTSFPSTFPSTPLGVYEKFFSLMQATWKDTPASATEIIEALGSAGLGQLLRSADANGLDKWLTEVDYATQDAFLSIRRLKNGDSVDTTLCAAQVVINFGVQASSLMHRQADGILWSHL
jgi:hypothetical protein